MNLNELLTSQMGVYGQVFHNHVADLGDTVVGIAVPMGTLSTGTRAMWMELYIPLAQGSGAPVIHNFDVAPANNDAGLGGILPPQTFAWYPVNPTAQTLLLVAQAASMGVLVAGASTRLDINWYRQAIT